MQRGRISPFQFSRLTKMVRESRPDVVQTWMYHADLLGGLASRLSSKSPIVWNIRHTNLDFGANKLSTLAVAKASALLSHTIPSRIISVASVSAERHVRFGYDRKRMIVIRNGVDTDAFKPDPDARAEVREEYDFAPESPIVAHFGRFHPQKDHATLVAAAKRIASVRPDCGFLFVGQGVDPSNADLSRWIASAGIGKQVRLLSERVDITRLASAADVVISSSIGEGFPNTVAESMACGTPCVVTDVGDSALLVPDPNQIVRPGDAETMAQYVLRILGQDPEQAGELRKHARQHILDKFSMKAFIAEYSELYRSLVPGA